MAIHVTSDGPPSHSARSKPSSSRRYSDIQADQDPDPPRRNSDSSPEMDHVPKIQRAMLALGCILLKLIFVLQISTWQFCGTTDILKLGTCTNLGLITGAFILVLFLGVVMLWYFVTHKDMSKTFSRAIRLDTAVSFIFVSIGYSHPEFILVKGWIWVLVGWYMAILLSSNMSRSKHTLAIYWIGIIGVALSSILHYIPEIQQHDYLTITTLFSVFFLVVGSNHGGSET